MLCLPGWCKNPLSAALWALAFFPAFFLQAQENLNGVVMEEDRKGTLLPLVGVNVFWLNSTIGAATDSNGIFVLPWKPEYRQLVVSYVGYEPDTITIEKPDRVTVILKNKTTLKEVEVIYREKSTSISYLDPVKVEVMTEKELFKAACCNLSESFETNPSVDVSFTDAVTGTRQIQLLGLAGPNTQISREMIPFSRGLSAIYGMEYIPGTWIKSIQISKGTGSVVDGYEGLTGQINVELHKPEVDEPFFGNAFVNQSGRAEANLIISEKFNNKWASSLLVHSKYRPFKIDNNNDGFMDNPLSQHLLAMNRWKFDNGQGIRSQLSVSGLYFDSQGGQMTFNPTDQVPTAFYGTNINTYRWEAFGKTGYVFPEAKYKSIGLQVSGIYEDQLSYFGRNNYTGLQQSFYAKLLYQSIIVHTNHRFTTGLSFVGDHFDETLNQDTFQRTDIVPGAFFEYSYSYLDKFNLITGIRGDHHSYTGFFLVPRVHARYAINKKIVARASMGRGQRIASIFSEHLGMLATSRQIFIQGDSTKPGYGLDPDRSWNFGTNLTWDFKLDYRDGQFSVDLYRTFFENRVIFDLDKHPQQVWFYNLSGESYANSFQAQVQYELLKRLEVRLAYRWYDVRSTYSGQLLQEPLIARQRAFTNWAYETRNGWKFDVTGQWTGIKRIPDTQANPESLRLPGQSPVFFLVNSQISKTWKEKLEVYVGGENLTNYRQPDPILSADQPFGPYFDSSLIWGPIFGRMFYAGLRYKIFD